jgi:hypothetical protein
VIVPDAAFHVTDLSVTVPCTDAANCAVAPVLTEAVTGEIAIEVTVGVAGAAITVTEVEADFVVSATLVAVTVSVLTADGAAYTPAEVIVPFTAFQVTAVLVVEPWTVAENGIVVPTTAEGDAGEIVTPVTGAVVAAAVPCRGTTTGLALALVTRVSMPLTVPVELASKVTVKLWLWPGVRERGAVRPERAKPVPETWIWLMVRLALPVLLAVTLCEPITPTVALTETLLGVTESCAAAGVAGVEGEEDDEGVLLTAPAQPEATRATVSTTRINTRNGPRSLRGESMNRALSLPVQGFLRTLGSDCKIAEPT